MGRPKLPRTKEQIAIRLTPGTKDRLASVAATIERATGRPALRSDILRLAIEQGLTVLESSFAAAAQGPQVQTRQPPARGSLADRTLAKLRAMDAGLGDVIGIPALCRAAWSPNPSRVHEALRELSDRGFVQLCSRGQTDVVVANDDPLVMRVGSQCLVGVRLV